MSEWRLTSQRLKNYPHFDAPISSDAAESYVKNSIAVARHPFFPFIAFEKRWTRFARPGEPGTPKSRPLRYGARRDAYIFSYYRHQLSELYENEILRLGLSENVLAYRRIPIGKARKGNKCNIHFANDAFCAIRRLGSCYVIALDISKYFDSLDHDLLKNLWCRLLKVNKLPLDHLSVFKAITSYSIVNKNDVYRQLEYIGKKWKGGKEIEGYLVAPRDIPKQLCSGKEFREKIAGCTPSIIKKNDNAYGIPQGAPLSDLLANLYLIDFDSILANEVSALRGTYYRYSDDIFIAVPLEGCNPKELAAKVQTLISSYGSNLKIKEEKTSICEYLDRGDYQSYRLISGKGRNGIEYLGFRYDGKRVYIRDSTLSNLRRKVANAAKVEANKLVRRYRDKDLPSLLALFNMEKFIQRFSKVEDIEIHAYDKTQWTFWTYAKRASKELGPLGLSIIRQLAKNRDLVVNRVTNEISKTYNRLNP